jgi:hypothetical protein
MKERKTQALAGVASELNAELGLLKVYEVIDTSDDEYYKILGLFDSFDAAKSKIDELSALSDPISFHADGSDYEKIEIVERYLGWGDKKKILFTIEREPVVNDEIDEFVWVVKT